MQIFTFISSTIPRGNKGYHLFYALPIKCMDCIIKLNSCFIPTLHAVVGLIFCFPFLFLLQSLGPPHTFPCQKEKPQDSDLATSTSMSPQLGSDSDKQNELQSENLTEVLAGMFRLESNNFSDFFLPCN